MAMLVRSLSMKSRKERLAHYKMYMAAMHATLVQDITNLDTVAALLCFCNFQTLNVNKLDRHQLKNCCECILRLDPL